MSDTGAHRNADTLRALYADLTRIGEFAAEDITYHLAARDTPQGAADLRALALRGRQDHRALAERLPSSAGRRSLQ
jgi:hypothetical protein